MNNTKKILPVICVFIFLLASCDDWFVDALQESPPHIMSSLALYQDRAGFEAALNGLYAKSREEESIQAFFDLTRVGTDGFSANLAAGPHYTRIAEVWGSLHGPTHRSIEDPWIYLYEVINIANNIIAQAEAEDAPLTVDDKNLISADARAVRAWAYRHLTYLYGDVPLTLLPSSGATIKTDWSRTPIDEVREKMIEDWLFAAQHLPVEATLPGRMTLGAVQHYLAEIYIVEGEYNEALNWANQAINNPAYELITERYGVASNEPGVPLMDMFIDGNADRESGNTEALWVTQLAEGVSGGELFNFRKRNHMNFYARIVIDGVPPFRTTGKRGGEGRVRISFTKWALDLYEPGDDRISEHAIRTFLVIRDAEFNAPQPADRPPPGWAFGDTLHFDWSQDLTPETVPNFAWPWSRKVEGANPATPSMRQNYKNIPYLRLADTYLLKAEAQYHLGDLSGAAETINIVRRRSNASDITAADVDIDFILDERQRELAIEEQRRYTLLRTGKWMERTRLYNKNGGQHIAEKDKLLPIPQSVIDANETVFPQNPGY